ncbi:uncharacterized protein LOC108274132 [Ictalurus punctatus]|uniref:Uncharacterized protein LOC108274132 n=1 Tax=Ictalurus punctatus TaxID=7998 RepID=A0A2D0S9X2_ICTPU|nr:uncharacterized protein LOC108274132 [Ictalurus punctatus]
MMTTLTVRLCFIAVVAAYSVQGSAPAMENGFVKMKKGQNFTMKCNTDDNEKDNLELYARLPGKHVVGVYDKQTNNVTLSNEYSKRVKISGPLQKVTMTISDLQLKDSGLYIGLYKKYDVEKKKEVEEEGCSILLFVNDVDKTYVQKSTGKESSAMSEPLVLISVLTACTMFVVFFLVMWVIAPKVKARCVNQADDASREYNPVYEDMHRVNKK